jgi:hypothetical protein
MSPSEFSLVHSLTYILIHSLNRPFEIEHKKEEEDEGEKSVHVKLKDR